MENLGAFLKEKREAVDLSLEELVSQTRIPLRYIEAIEANQFDLLPNMVSAKGFLRSYAECVGVDFSVISEAFVQYQPVKESFVNPENRDEILSYLDVKRTMRVPFPRRIIFSIGAVVLFLIVLVGLLSNKGNDFSFYSSSPLLSNNPLQEGAEPPVFSEPPIFSESPESSEEMVLAEQDAENLKNEIAPQNVLPEKALDRTPEVVATTKPLLPETSAPVISNPLPEAEVATVKPHRLFLEATEASWVQVTIDDSEVKEALLQPNDTVQWKAKKKFLLTLGNAGGVRVQLDGQDLGPLGPSGEVVHRELFGRSSDTSP